MILMLRRLMIDQRVEHETAEAFGVRVHRDTRVGRLAGAEVGIDHRAADRQRARCLDVDVVVARFEDVRLDQRGDAKGIVHRRGLLVDEPLIAAIALDPLLDKSGCRFRRRAA
jgi:hypothetical protein